MLQHFKNMTEVNKILKTEKKTEKTAKDLDNSYRAISIIDTVTGKEEIYIRKSKFMAIVDAVETILLMACLTTVMLAVLL